MPPDADSVFGCGGTLVHGLRYDVDAGSIHSMRSVIMRHSLLLPGFVVAAAVLAGSPARAQASAPPAPGARPEMTESCPGLVASAEPRPVPVALRLAALGADQVRITFAGHSTFLIES